jgi:molybdopterin converting factor small subunit
MAASRTSIRVLLFGPLAQRAGRRVVDIDAPLEPATCAELRARLAAAHPALGPLLPACRIAVNGRFALEDEVVTPEDEVALIGMVSGG